MKVLKSGPVDLRYHGLSKCYVKLWLPRFLNVYFWGLFQLRTIEDARKTYERLVSQFPSAGRYWKIYIEQEVSKFYFNNTYLGILK